VPPAAGARPPVLPKHCQGWCAGARPRTASRGEEEVRGKWRGTEGFFCGSNRPALPGGLKLILEKGILLVFRAFN